MFRHVIVACSLVGLIAPAALAQTVPDPRPMIVAQGTGTIKRAPDQAFVTIAAETRAATPADAQRLAAEAMTAVQKALSAAALPADAVKTTAYSLQPDLEWNNGRSRVRGYIARNQIEVRVDDLAKIGQVIDAAGAAGATQMAGLRFDIKERAALEQEALRLAVQDAMGRARAMAAGANASLGAILRIEEGAGMPVPRPEPYMMRSVADAAPQTPVTPGDLEIRAQVTVSVGVRPQ